METANSFEDKILQEAINVARMEGGNTVVHHCTRSYDILEIFFTRELNMNSLLTRLPVTGKRSQHEAYKPTSTWPLCYESYDLEVALDFHVILLNNGLFTQYKP